MVYSQSTGMFGKVVWHILILPGIATRPGAGERIALEVPGIDFMPSLKAMLDPKTYFSVIMQRLDARRVQRHPNFRGVAMFTPGHFYSPLLDLENLDAGADMVPFDGPECWEHIELRPSEQRAYYRTLIEKYSATPFPAEKKDGFRYYTQNFFFRFADAFTLWGILQHEKPQRIIEVGSGFSSAVMLDTLNHTRTQAELTFIEPFPDRLRSLLSVGDQSAVTVLDRPVQEIALSVFDQLRAQDILFIDSSHVAKLGSDVVYLFLRILPRLAPGVLVHVHDIFYPFSYPMEWVKEGRAWNESLFLRAFLLGNSNFQVVAFNSFAGHTFPDQFRDLPEFLQDTGGSIWFRKVS